MALEVSTMRNVELLVTNRNSSCMPIHTDAHTHIYVCVCVCVCMCNKDETTKQHGSTLDGRNAGLLPTQTEDAGGGA